MSYIDRVFDRVPHWDERNNEYHIRELIGTPEIKEKVWDLPECLDQGSEGACVGFGWTHELLAEPHRIVGQDPRAIYHRAQQLDEWAGEAYSGTSVLAGAKAVQEFGHLIEYRWALDIRDVLATLSVHGPVVIGVNWHEGMVNTDADGYIRPTGAVQGGHCVCLIGVMPNPSDPYGWSVFGRNSWGAAWGIGGNFKMTASDLKALMAARGEICVPVLRVPAAVVTPEPELPPSTIQLLELFKYEHLPEHLQSISKLFHDLAWTVAQEATERGAEQTVCVRKLLEAKDCAVRMKVPLGYIGSDSPPL